MSSWKNAIPRRKYRERTQPESRKHLGLLEKKQDYLKRAKHFHALGDQLSNLQEKALGRNHDEFYYAMNNSQFVAGKHRKTPTAESPQTLKKRQMKDSALLQLKTQTIGHRKDKILANSHELGLSTANLHIQFTEAGTQHISGQVPPAKPIVEQLSQDEEYLRAKLRTLEHKQASRSLWERKK